MAKATIVMFLSSSLAVGSAAMIDSYLSLLQVQAKSNTSTDTAQVPEGAEKAWVKLLPWTQETATPIKSKALTDNELCMDASLGYLSHHQLYMHKCNYMGHQKFYLQKKENGKITVHVRSKGNGLCVDQSKDLLKENGTNPKHDYNALYLHPCNGHVNEEWKVENGTLQTFWADGYKCMTFEPSDRTLGMRPCDLTFTDIYQQFYFDSDDKDREPIIPGHVIDSLGLNKLPTVHEVRSAVDPSVLTWQSINAKLACEENDEGITRTFGAFGHTFETCKNRCILSSGCQAIDFFVESGWCNTFDAPCTSPKLKRHGASSYALHTSCPIFRNGDLEYIKQRALQGPVYANEEKRSLARARDEHTYVFVIGMPFTGTTSLLSLLASSPEVGNLCADPRTDITCEGTWLLTNSSLIPESDASDQTRWELEYPADWNQALEIFNGVWNVSKKVLVDKSPSNSVKMLRIAQDLARTGNAAYFLVLSRNPCYSNETQVSNRDLGRSLKMAADFQQLPSSQVMHVQYEELIRDPYNVASKILDFLPQLGQLDPSREFRSNTGYNVTETIRKHPEHAGKDESVVGYIESRYPFIWPQVTLDNQSWAGFLQTFGY